MDSEQIRFRMDAHIREQAMQACAKLGIDLHDVLRACVTRIARDGVLPFDLGAPIEVEQARRPFYDYEERLWSAIKPAVEADVAVMVLVRFIAQCSSDLDEEAGSAKLSPQSRLELANERQRAQQIKDHLDLNDASALRQAVREFGPRLRTGGA